MVLRETLLKTKDDLVRVLSDLDARRESAAKELAQVNDFLAKLDGGAARETSEDPEPPKRTRRLGKERGWDRVKDLLMQTPEGLTTPEIIEKTGLNPRHVSNIISDMRKEKLVTTNEKRDGLSIWVWIQS